MSKQQLFSDFLNWSKTINVFLSFFKGNLSLGWEVSKECTTTPVLSDQRSINFKHLALRTDSWKQKMKKNVWTGRVVLHHPLAFRDQLHEDFLSQKRFYIENLVAVMISLPCTYPANLPTHKFWNQKRFQKQEYLGKKVSEFVKYWGISFCFTWYLIILLDAVQYCIRRNIKYSFCTHPYSALETLGSLWTFIHIL